MSKRELLSQEEMSALLDDDAFSEHEFESFGEELFSPTDFADFCELVAPLLFGPMARLAPLIDSTIELQSPELALVSNDLLSTLNKEEQLIIPVSFLKEGKKRYPDALILLPVVVAARIAVLMIGGEPDNNSRHIENAQLSTVDEFFRQYRLLLGRVASGDFLPKASVDRSPHLKALLAGSDKVHKIADRIFDKSEHVVQLSGVTVLNDIPPVQMSFLFPLDVSQELLKIARNLSVSQSSSSTGSAHFAEVKSKVESETKHIDLSISVDPSEALLLQSSEVTSVDPSESKLLQSSKSSDKAFSVAELAARRQLLDRAEKSLRESARATAALRDSIPELKAGLSSYEGFSDDSTEFSSSGFSSFDSGLKSSSSYSSSDDGTGNRLIIASLGKVSLTVQNFDQLKKGDVVKLDNLAAEEVDLLVDGKVIGRGEVVVEDDCYAVKISSVSGGKRQKKKNVKDAK